MMTWGLLFDGTWRVVWGDPVYPRGGQRQNTIEASAEVCYMLRFEKNGKCF